MRTKFLLALVCVGIITLGNFSATAESFGALNYNIKNGCAVITGLRTNADSVTIPDKIGDYPVTEIADGAFYEKSIETVTIGENVTSIGDESFYMCENLNSLTLPNSVQSIGNSAFEGCSALSEVYFGKNVKNIGNKAFFYCKVLKEIALPDSIVTLGNESFAQCTSLEKLTLGNGISEIGAGAFKLCKKLKNVNLPNGITNVGNEAFASCNSLETAVFGTGVTKIGDKAFSDCGKIQSAELPDKLGEIGIGAFEYTAIESLTLPCGLTKIGQGAFKDCAINKVRYNGTSEQFAKISIGDDNNAVTEADISYFFRADISGGKTIILEKVKPGCNAVFAAYKNDVLAAVECKKFNNENLTFDLPEDCTSAKFMLWDSLTSQTPLRPAEIVK